ncbi:probable arginine--tRNA ligase, mitochondrial [Alosa sapidissima]|uniref:probable arginine--tRNA ligase, mitochondrial n=1 Tax=Alosa sapidissima TaxID=34773 RepID=UPI001C0830D5|nr:probable arginine--tRNA ligase, mitochondrial [Alosa sapidissima]
MACFFRRKIATQLSRIFGHKEDVFIPAISAIPVSKKQISPDLKLSVSSLVSNGFLSSDGDFKTTTESLARQLKADEVIEEVIPSRGGIHFRINKIILAKKLLEQLHKDPQRFGVQSEIFRGVHGRKTLVEFSSPNIAKKFHAGHLRSTIIGNFISNLKVALGNEVIRVNYLGDWGMQFGLLGAGFQRLGSQDKLRDNPLQHLFDVYVHINREAENDEAIQEAAREFFRRLEDGDEQSLSLWKQFREITVDEYKRIYKRLGVHFDHYSGESFHQSKTQDVLQQLRDLGLLKVTEKGTGVVDVSPTGDMSNYAIVQRSDGTSLYITRDIAAALDRKEKYDFDDMIYVTDKSQGVHFRQLFQILLAMQHPWAERCCHVPFGLVQGMSTRRGEVVFLEDVLDEARNRMLRNMSQSRTTKDLDDPEDTAEKVGISALIVQDFKGPVTSDYKFDWDRVLQSQGDTGVFLQYTHARLRSLIRMYDGAEESSCDPVLLQDKRSILIFQHLLRYDEVLHQCDQELQPRYLVNFLMTLCHLVASAHKELPVKGSPSAVAQARLQLFGGACTVLANGMAILGIVPVDKM